MPSPNIIFDLGGVLVDWNPKYLYRKIFADLDEMDYFLMHVCSPDWNEEQDAGRDFEEAIRVLSKQFPNYHKQIAAFYERWTEMLNGSITQTVDILTELYHHEINLYALTNWSHQTFHHAVERYEFLDFFIDIVVSGIEKVRKPDHKVFQILLDRNKLKSSDCLFIDDSKRNIVAARKMGFETIHFESPKQLRLELIEKGYL